MKTKLIIALALLITISCTKKKDIELNLLNEKLHYATIFDSPKDSSGRAIMNSVYFRYQNNNDWLKSINNVKFELTNNSNEKLFVLTKNIITDNFYKGDNIETSNLYYQIQSSKNEDLYPIPFGLHDLPRLTNEVIQQYEKDSLAEEITIYNSYDDEKRLSNFEILAPNESINVKSILSLPLSIDYNVSGDQTFALPLYSNSIYKFKLYYVINKNDIESSMPKKILDSLKKEEVIIKDIYLISKEIEVLPNEKNLN
ncbi:hypothetical protein [Psychroserpens sp. Hel_I_66]|uniref:hypothetical protein n=1 Tax=Psychroserpens sp. Hel_I_66 TaxID=1250004 RepID=UPI000645BF71|nr:hypothetical protein [Psychroserpens sp. Hel_I_66]